MAYEAAVSALDGRRRRRARSSPSASPRPSACASCRRPWPARSASPRPPRSTSAAARARCWTPSSWPGRSRQGGGAAGAGGGLRPPGQLRGARLRHALGRRRRGLPGGRPRAASRASGPSARAGREVYDVWRLGTEPEPRYRLEVLFDAYARERRGGARRVWSGPPSAHRPTTPPSAPASPTPRPCAGWAGGGQRRAAREHELRGRDRQPGRGLGRHRPGPRPRRAPRPATTCWRSATAAGRRSPRTIEVTGRPCRRPTRPPRSRARRSICPRTTVGPAAARPNPTREA